MRAGSGGVRAFHYAFRYAIARQLDDSQEMPRRCCRAAMMLAI